jgi:hypothetical protein
MYRDLKLVELRLFGQEASEASEERLMLVDQGLLPGSAGSNPDGRYLAAAGSDGAISIYVMSVEELMEVARSRLSRDFTDVECRTYLSLDECPEAP